MYSDHTHEANVVEYPDSNNRSQGLWHATYGLRVCTRLFRADVPPRLKENKAPLTNVAVVPAGTWEKMTKNTSTAYDQ